MGSFHLVFMCIPREPGCVRGQKTARDIGNPLGGGLNVLVMRTPRRGLDWVYFPSARLCLAERQRLYLPELMPLPPTEKNSSHALLCVSTVNLTASGFSQTARGSETLLCIVLHVNYAHTMLL